MGKKVKFMGSSHEHTLDKGDNFGGRLGEGLPKKVVFNRDNGWVVDAAEVGLTDAAVAVLVESGDFKDVTDMERVPTNLHQQIFLQMPASEKVEGEEDDSEDEEPVGASDEQKPDDGEPATGTTTEPRGRRGTR